MHKDLIFVVTVEVYGQAKSIDIHAETSLKSFPSVSGSPYDALSVGIHEEADGAGMKRKLKIASKTMTVLITLSASLSPQPTVNIGPERASTIEMINPSSARICYFEEEIDKFLTAMKQGTTLRHPSLYHLSGSSCQDLTIPALTFPRVRPFRISILTSSSRRQCSHCAIFRTIKDTVLRAEHHSRLLLDFCKSLRSRS